MVKYFVADSRFPIALIHIPPLYSKPENKSRRWIEGCGKIIIYKSKSVLKANCIQIFPANVTGESPDAKMYKQTDIGQVADSNRVLRNKLAKDRGISICFVRGIVPGLKACTQF